MGMLLETLVQSDFPAALVKTMGMLFVAWLFGCQGFHGGIDFA
jgi:hypothetical protein